MDVITHLALGACIGELTMGKKWGKSALLVGAIMQCVPDADVVTVLWMNPADALLAHRGFSHSILFVILFSVITGGALFKWDRQKKVALSILILFAFIELSSHIFIDAFNAYGTGWFEPFSHYRVSFNAIFVVDPIFFLWVGTASLILIIIPASSTIRKRWAKLGLIGSSVYVILCLFNKAKIDAATKTALSVNVKDYQHSFSTPAPFTNLFWYIVAKKDSGCYIGYRSVFDTSKHMDFVFFPTNENLIIPFENRSDVKKLKRFSKDLYVVSSSESKLVFNDVRFGQVMGWQNPRARFVFHYQLQPGVSNRMVLQQDRFANWNQQTFASYIKRIMGQ